MIDKLPVLFDTDVGTDPDDLLAMLVIAALPQIELVGITTSYGDTVLRSRIAAEICDMLGLSVPIGAGPVTTVSGKEVWYAGNEKSQIPDNRFGEFQPVDAVELIDDLATRYHGELRVLCVAPATTLATAMREGVSGFASITMMGGAFDGTVEHNWASDVDAIRLVLERAAGSGVPVTTVGVEQTRRLSIDDSTIADLTEDGGELGRRTLREVRWWERFHAESAVYVHDPLAVLLLAEPDRFETRTRSIIIGDDAAVAIDSEHDGMDIGVVSDFDPPAVQDRLLELMRTSLHHS